MQQLRQVHQARDRLEHDRIRHAPGFSRGDHAAAGRGAGRDSAEHPVPRRRRQRQRPGGMRFTVDDVRSAGDPAKIDRALELLVAAERPLIAGGDGLFWSQAGPELREFVELTSIPVYARRAGQGSVSEEHPLAIRGAFKKPFTGRADVVLDARLPLLERRAFRPPPDLERQGQIHPGRSDPDPHRMAGAGRRSDGRRSQARAAPDDQSDQGAQARLLEESQLAVDQGAGRGALQLRAAGDRERQEVSQQPPDSSGASRARPGLGARQKLRPSSSTASRSRDG